MPLIVIETFVLAPPQLCFDYARDIGLHCETLKETGECAIAGTTSGRIGPGESVTFEGRHFGFKQRHTSQIVEFDPPQRFVDEMTQGTFKAMRHVHEFVAGARDGESGTLMRDVLEWTSPLGPLGTLADILLVRGHLRKILERRAERLKALLEKQTTVRGS
jgi:ligand-binding SRPBCC domain-containing protein